MRDNNEDNYLVKKESPALLAVADGMGGHQAGEIASSIAVSHLKNLHLDPEEDLQEKIVEAIIEINKEILKKGEEDPSYYGMGTTLSLGVIYRQELYVGHIGDSRIYLFRNNNLEQLTNDHSLVNELIKKEKISPEEAFHHPQRHILTQALGMDGTLEIETKRVSLQQGDLLLFCTDGLSDMIDFKQIQTLLNSESDINKLSNLLGKQAMENGGLDNITLIICRMG